MPTPTPIVLNLYDENNEKVKTITRTFVPWKMLKRGVALQKALGSKSPEQYEEADIDELTSYIISVFGHDLTIAELDEHADVTEMMTVIRSVVSRARGVMDPTLPQKAA